MSTRHDANTVLLPIVDTLTISPHLDGYLRNGGVSVLLASSGEEYNARRISDDRRRYEHWADIRRFIEAVSTIADRDLLFAADAEPTGVQRFEHLLPPLPARNEALNSTAEELTETYSDYATAARKLGVNLFLAPVADEITGKNEWLEGRTLSHDHTLTEKVTVSFVRAASSHGVATTAKHFPGFSDLESHPVANDVVLKTERRELERQGRPFRALIEAGVPAVMVGPTTVTAYDPDQPASTSSVIIELLRSSYGFPGLIVSDDLDAASTLRGRALETVAIESIRAGVELLLIPGEETITSVATALHDEAHCDAEFAASLSAAAARVRDFARVWN